MSYLDILPLPTVKVNKYEITTTSDEFNLSNTNKPTHVNCNMDIQWETVVPINAGSILIVESCSTSDAKNYLLKLKPIGEIMIGDKKDKTELDIMLAKIESNHKELNKDYEIKKQKYMDKASETIK